MILRMILIATLLAGSLAACGKFTDTDAARIEENLRLQNEEIWSKGNFDFIPRLYTEDYVGHFPGGETIHGREALRDMVAAHRAAFPNWHEEVLEVMVDGNRAATFYHSQGTQEGDFLGLPASGRDIDILEASIYRMEDGKIAEQWAFPDILSLQQQLSGARGE